jgi:GNAT superfamily N-acetyltransferase
MFTWPFKWEHYRLLRRGEPQLLFDHLVRLSDKDLYERFLAFVDDSDLLAHVNRDHPEHETIGWFSRGKLRGAVEIFYGDDVAEAGLTVEAGWRGQGIGGELVRRALSRVRDRGVGSLDILGYQGNYPLLAIAARYGAIESPAANRSVKGLLPVDDDRAVRFSFDTWDSTDQPQPGQVGDVAGQRRSW